MIQWKITAGRSGGGSSPIYFFFFLIICEDKTV